MLDSIDSLITSLSTYLEDAHSSKLQSRLKTLNFRYKMLGFNTQVFPLEAWLQTRFVELNGMRKTSVLVHPLTTQVHEVGRFQHQVEAYKPRLSELKEAVSSLPDQSDLSPAKIKMEFVFKEYETLVKLTGRRSDLLGSFLPRVKLYEGSLENWEKLLTEWEESTASLTPPITTVTVLQSQVEAIKVFQNQGKKIKIVLFLFLVASV